MPIPALKKTQWLLLVILTASIYQCKLFQKTEKRAPAPVSSREVTFRRDIVSYATRYKGAKYTPAGKKPSTGFDCSGFTSYVMDHFNISLSPAAREQVKQGRERPVEDAKPGDLIFFRRGPGQPIFHVSLVKSNNGKSLYVIHSTTSRGVIEEDVLSSSYWKPYIDSARDVVSAKF
ncbi:MAG: C40 family peptidase [Saprospiraceae bacterium]